MTYHRDLTAAEEAVVAIRVTVFLCSAHLTMPESEYERDARERRARRDWKIATDPVDSSSLRPDQLPEQIPSEVRRSIRAFYDSGTRSAVVIGISTTTLNQSLTSLGLQHEMYAEERSRQTILRRV